MGGLAFPKLDDLIGKFEGFGQPGAFATIDNNPGNLVAGPFATARGATGVNKGFAVFPDAATGLKAADSLVAYMARQGATIQSLAEQWAPPGAPGNSRAGTDAYTSYLSKGMGVDKSTPVSSLTQDRGTLYTIPDLVGILNDSIGAAVPGATAVNAAKGVYDAVTGNVAGKPVFTWTRAIAAVIGVASLIVGLVALVVGKDPQTIVINAAKAGADAVAA